MADIEQNLQEIEQQQSRLSIAKANLKTAITEKGVTVADDVKLDQYYTLVNNIQVGGGGFNTSDATVEDSDIVLNKIGYGKDGKIYGSRKYVTDGTVYFSQGNLCTSEPVYLDPNNPVEIFSFDAFTDPMYIANGKTAYVGGGLVTGTMVRLGAGHMIINAGGTLDIPLIGYFEYASMDMKTIPGIGDLAPENIAYGKTICGITGTHGGSIPGNTNDYVLPDDFTDDLKVVIWQDYNVAAAVYMEFSNGSGTSRVWQSISSSALSLELKYTGSWVISQTSTGLPLASNTTLQKRNWVVPADVDAGDYVTLEDKDWTYS